MKFEIFSEDYSVRLPNTIFRKKKVNTLYRLFNFKHVVAAPLITVYQSKQNKYLAIRVISSVIL